MTKAKRALEDKLKQIDVVIEVLDARAPISTTNPDVEELFSNKLKMYVLNKSDLADNSATERWKRFYESSGEKVFAFSAASGDPKKLRVAIEDCAKPLYDKFAARGIKRAARCAVCGVPNVGKSAILNRLCGSRRMEESNRPGVTRGLHWVRITPYLELLDSPGLLWPKLDDQRAGAIIALLGSIRNEVLEEDNLALYLLEMLSNSAPELILSRYDVSPEKDAYSMLEKICVKRGFLLKKGEPDTERGARTILSEFKNGKMGRVTLELPS